MGFEPMKRHSPLTRFRDERLQPLGHLSTKKFISPLGNKNFYAIYDLLIYANYNQKLSPQHCPTIPLQKLAVPPLASATV